jgi:hypothetical protein
MARDWKPPTREDIARWPTSKLLACYVQVVADPRANAVLRALYAAELDRRIPPSAT